MQYYDIHTHHQPQHPEDIAVLNYIVPAPDAGSPGQLPVSAAPNGEAACSLCAPASGVERRLFFSVGIHPCYIYNVEEQMAELERLAADPRVVAIGECGLDKLAATPLNVQQLLLKRLALFAEKSGIFLLIHCVKAWAELIAVRKEVKPSIPWVIHGFRGNGELAKQLLKQGFYLSFGEYFHPEAVRAAWPDRLFVETDDREIDIRLFYTRLAGVLSLPPEEVAAQIEKNVCQTLCFPCV